MLAERFYPLSHYYHKKFGKPVFKAAIDAGLSCPHANGTGASSGCIFCRGRSGYFTYPGTITQQLQREAARIHRTHPEAGILAYFQAGTNTYGPTAKLRACYAEAMAFPGVVGISIATRPDCLPPEVLTLLEGLAKRIPLTVELGLQTVHDQTADIIRRGYLYDTFIQAYQALRTRNIRICLHLINGLPGETDQEMLETARVIGRLYPDGVKIHLLHVLQNTPLAVLYENGAYTPLSRAEYIQITAAQLALLPKTTVIERLTGDGDIRTLLAPLWSRNKSAVRNAIIRHLKQTDSWQGKAFDTLQAAHCVNTRT